MKNILSIFGIFNNLVELKEKYGNKKFYSWIAGISLFILVGTFSVSYANKYGEYLAKEHAEKIDREKLDKRDNATFEIRETLHKLLMNSKADKAMIVEFHNGKENATGLPFKYGTWSYEESANDNDKPIGYKYEEMNLSRIKAPDYLYENKFFIGTIEEFKDVDPILYPEIKEDGCQYMGLILIRKNSINIGILMISYFNEPNMSKDKIHAILGEYVQEIGESLTLDK